ncbi:hypothetical protein BN1263560007 [Stenotrophomonas indicatrix]|nr:hypothetical protein BN1263560007 [Stenotrophomonas indicatrix]
MGAVARERFARRSTIRAAPLPGENPDVARPPPPPPLSFDRTAVAGHRRRAAVGRRSCLRPGEQGQGHRPGPHRGHRFQHPPHRR